MKKFKILLLYDMRSMHINTIYEYLSSFSFYSENEIYYAASTHQQICGISLDIFDAVIIHYSVRLSLNWHLSPNYAEAIKNYKGMKILYIQDEYDTTETARNWINVLGIKLVFTCVPDKFVEAVYPSKRFNGVEFINVLTGYVPLHFEDLNHYSMPQRKRTTIIGYRGRSLPYWYGNLGQEKLWIGQKMRQICNERNILVDIEWDEHARIYGDKWYEFVGSCKATLGVESGSNVFDDYGMIKDAIERELERNPKITYAEVFDKYLAEHEAKVIMNQISPRIFESIALRTALVLFEGNYSGVIEPDKHYIPLKKDFSNVEQVLAKLENDDYLEQMTEQAYKDIILSHKYTYKNFIAQFDSILKRKITPQKKEINGLMSLIGFINQDSVSKVQLINSDLLSAPTNIPLCYKDSMSLQSLKIINSSSNIVANDAVCKVEFVENSRLLKFIYRYGCKLLPNRMRVFLGNKFFNSYD